MNNETDRLKQTRAALKREFEFTDKDFEFIRRFVYEHSGIKLSDIKKDMVYSRLARRLRALKLTKFSQYCDYVQANETSEMGHMINSITTNLTHFFREGHHFDLLKSDIFPGLSRKQPRGKRLRIWSAGCSTGEEPYSIAITMLNSFPGIASWDSKILATDLDTNVLEHCKAGRYDKRRIEGLPSDITSKWFIQEPVAADKVSVVPKLQEFISFKQLNLMLNRWPMHGPFDIIFCRNVIIYFDKPTQQKLFQKFYDLLAPGGYLFLGHSEQLGEFQNRFELLGKTAFKKPGG